MEPLTSATWTEALKLYQWVCTFARVAPRKHEEWWLDVGAIMRLEARDPRGWESIDPYEGEDERREDPLFPWLETPRTSADVERYRAQVKELPRSSVKSLLILLGASPHTNLYLSPDWKDRLPEMERRAGVLMSRFPVGTHFYTNLGWRGDTPDFNRQSSRLQNPFSCYDWDAGLIAVNDDEVAVFWNFQSL
ncbi:hypothetical protein EDD96_3804 [Streptomyces sp. Ag109_G2-6]|uniref:hypothetical protein n=1 Tax=Streptomyces TaxID=1883 RepID=UPI000F4FF9F5|nr:MULTISPECIES: hypothetical protein [Streptomyces]RPF40051.1 hypothetical protein EDD96_3804 [Streptomyces sp. Ag109_G2-6]